MFVGSKYEGTKRLDVRDIAKLIRKDLKREFPDVKVSLTIDRYAGGSAINCRITDVPFNPLNLLFDDSVPGIERQPRYNERGRNLLERVREIMGKYNYDRSESQTDYYDVKFSPYVYFDQDELSAWEDGKKVSGDSSVDLLRDSWLRMSKSQKVEFLEARGLHPSWAETETIEEMVERGGGLAVRELHRVVKEWKRRNFF